MKTVLGFQLFGLVFVLVNIAAWITHVVFCIKSVMDEPTAIELILLFGGSLVAPIGAIHGWCIWFGNTWI